MNHVTNDNQKEVSLWKFMKSMKPKYDKSLHEKCKTEMTESNIILLISLIENYNMNISY